MFVVCVTVCVTYICMLFYELSIDVKWCVFVLLAVAVTQWTMCLRCAGSLSSVKVRLRFDFEGKTCQSKRDIEFVLPWFPFAFRFRGENMSD